MKTIGIDVGSSSVKVSLLDIETGAVFSATNPKEEMPISSPQQGWAEQNPEMWWDYVCKGIREVGEKSSLKDVAAIGITYQMHGLVIVDKEGKALRDAIIWCDSRAVGIGNEAMEKIGAGKCLEHVLNSPGNFTASKLKWVKDNEPETYSKIYKAMLPGDYIAYRLSNEISTTSGGFSEGILWDFKEDRLADFILDNYGISAGLLPETHPQIGLQSKTTADIEKLLGIPEGTPVTYRAGDQPNNAFSLNVLSPGEIAATGGTSGVVYGVTDLPKADQLSRVNTFLHVNHTADAHRYGVLLCINGTGIMNSWVRRNILKDYSYEQINDLAAGVPAGSEGLSIIPFGNGAERVMENKLVGAQIMGLELNRHTSAHIARATQEGIAFSMRYGIDIMGNLGLKPKVIRAGRANMFLSPIFRTTLATLCDVQIELLNTDGSLGAARGAALGAGIFDSPARAFESLKVVDRIDPDNNIKDNLEQAYALWCERLANNSNN